MKLSCFSTALLTMVLQQQASAVLVDADATALGDGLKWA